MEVFEAIVLVIYWFGFYGLVMVFAWALDTALRKLFNKGIFPKGYFK